MIRQLEKQYPGAAISLMTFRKNREILDVLGYVPGERILTLDPGSGVSLVSSFFSTWRRMRRDHFDVVIDCELFHRISSITAWFSGAPIKVGFHPHTQEGLYRGSFINRRVLYNPYQHISRQFLNLVDAIDSDASPKSKRLRGEDDLAPPVVKPDPGEVEAMSERLRVRFPGSVDRKIALIYPSGGLLPIRAWPLESYCQLTRALLDRGYAVGVIGMPDDKPLADAILAACPSEACANLTGFTHSIRELIVLFHLVSLLVANDGGPGQFAAVTPLPTIMLFGPETPLLYGPTGRRVACLHQGIACSPCLTAYNHRNTPCDGDNVCLKSISVDHVMAEVDRLEVL
jgi:ADP-heptose:LPS heptosyltransferase